MTNKHTIIEQFKIDLFDLSMNHHHENIEKMLNKITAMIQKTVHAQRVEMALNHLQVISQTVAFYGEEEIQLLPSIQQTSEMNEAFAKKKLFHVTDKFGQLSSEDIYVYRLDHIHTFEGMILFTFFNDEQVNEQLVVDICDVASQFISVLVENDAEIIQKDRHTFLFQLASQLIGLNRTEDVLEVMFDSIRTYLPDNTYQIWMLKEIEHDGIPIKQVNQKKLIKNNFGFQAMFYKKLEVIYNEDKTETTYVIPFLGNRDVSGMLEVKSPQFLELKPSEYEFFEQFSKLVGQAIERTTLYQTSTKQIANLELINYTTRELNTKLDPKEIVQIVEQQITNNSYPEQYAFILFNQQTGKLDIAAEKDSFFQHLIGKRFMHFVYEHVKRTERSMFYGDFNGEAHHVPFRSIIAIPLYAENEMIGLLMLVHSSRYYFSHDTFKLFQSITQHVAIALMNAYLKEQLKQTIITDYLTQLYSRNYIDTFVMHHMKSGRKGAFILYDIDDFKIINDTYGHYIGDHVLVEVANIIQSNLETDDIAARWGGEEFAIYLPNHPMDKALELANIIREDIAQKTNPQVTVSGGVSEWEQTKEHSIETLFIEADEALYHAKNKGKNSISFQGNMEKAKESN